MTAPAIVARQVAVNCETRKIAYRQTKDGVVVSFVIHPNEVPDQLAIAPLGTRYMLALVELGDDEKPKEVMPNSGQSTAVREHKTLLVPPTDKAAGRAPKAWADLPLSQQAGIRCGEPAFWRFLEPYYGMIPIHNAENAAECVRLICGGIATRADLKRGTIPGSQWQQLDAAYQMWKQVAEVVPV